MSRASVGPIVTMLIVGGVGLILILNRAPSRSPSSEPNPRPIAEPATAGVSGEHPIGDDVVKNHMVIAAVWLPSVGMAGMPAPSDDVIHLEADIRATSDNPNGFAKDEFVPYLKIRYQVVDAKSGKILQGGDLLPMVASDGLHYGANIVKPTPGSYRLIYKIDPPSSGGLGRHVDAATGVAPWWEPFEAAFEWTVEPTEGKATAPSE